MHDLLIQFFCSSQADKMMLILISIILGLLALLYAYLQFKWSTWNGLDMKVLHPKFPFGSIPFTLTRSESWIEGMTRIARETNWAPAIGAYVLGNSILIIQDPDLAKQILVKDFGSFHDRAPDYLKECEHKLHLVDKLSTQNLLLASGETWKNLRSTFTPIFSSGKMKAMVKLFDETGTRLINHLDKLADNGKYFEAKDIFGKFSMDTIASCAFGVDAKTYDTTESAFVKHANKNTSLKIENRLAILKYLYADSPWIVSKFSKMLDITVFPKEAVIFLYNVVKQTLEMRQEHKIKRNDLIDMMMDAVEGNLEQGKEQEDQHRDSHLNHKVTKKLDDLAIISTAQIFLLAGYETTATTLAFACYELAKNPAIQDKLRKEVVLIVSDDDENIYEKLQSLTYMDQVLSEVLRYHTPLAVHHRNCKEDYKLHAEKNVLIPKNTSVWINAAALHSNPKYYANPNRFDPDHFSKEAKATRHP